MFILFRQCSSEFVNAPPECRTFALSMKRIDNRSQRAANIQFSNLRLSEYRRKLALSMLSESRFKQSLILNFQFSIFELCQF